MGRVYLHVHDSKHLIVMIFVTYYFWQLLTVLLVIMLFARREEKALPFNSFFCLSTKNGWIIVQPVIENLEKCLVLHCLIPISNRFKSSS